MAADTPEAGSETTLPRVRINTNITTARIAPPDHQNFQSDYLAESTNRSALCILPTAVTKEKTNVQRNSSTSSPFFEHSSTPNITADNINRKGGRGFTITVSPPLENLNLNIGSFCDMSADELEEQMLPRKPTFTKEDVDHLVPDEILTNALLDQTESRFPSLEDMLADDEIRKMLDSSEIHREIQEAILQHEDKEKYSSLMSIVEKSYNHSSWRKQAGEDKNLIDTLVLFARQRLTVVLNPFQQPGGDFMLRTNRRSGSRKMSNSSIDSVQAEDLRHICIVKPATALALISSAVKLLRNLCVEATECQMWLHEHRLVDLLLTHIDVIYEICYQSKTEAYAEEIPSWVTSELERFPRAFVQLITNIVSGNSKIQTHIIRYGMQDPLIKCLLLADDANLFCCLLHTLVLEQDAVFLHHVFVSETESGKTLFILLAFLLSYPITEEQDWGASLFSYILYKTYSNGFHTLVDLSSLWTSLKFHPLSHSPSFRTVGRSGSHRKFSSDLTNAESLQALNTRISQLLETPYNRVISGLLAIAEVTVEAEVKAETVGGKNKLSSSSLAGYIIASATTIEWLQRTLNEIGDLLGESSSTNTDPDSISVYNSIISLLLSLSVANSLLEKKKLPTDTVKKLCSSTIRNLTYLPKKNFMDMRKNLLLLLANLGQVNTEVQIFIGEENGLQVVLSHWRMSTTEPLLREAAIFALRCCCQIEENKKKLDSILSQTFKDIAKEEILKQSNEKN